MITDDFKIMTNRAILSLKEARKKDFKHELGYILFNLNVNEIKEYAEYLYEKLESEI